jgi:CRP-like cAMP-binding protein
LSEAEDCPVVSLGVNETLFLEGDAADAIYLIQKGTIDVIDELERTIIVTMKEGDVLGETAMLLRTKRNATAKTNGKNGATLLKVSRKRFMNLIGTQLRAELVKSRMHSFDRTMKRCNEGVV